MEGTKGYYIYYSGNVGCSYSAYPASWCANGASSRGGGMLGLVAPVRGQQPWWRQGQQYGVIDRIQLRACCKYVWSKVCNITLLVDNGRARITKASLRHNYYFDIKFCLWIYVGRASGLLPFVIKRFCCWGLTIVVRCCFRIGGDNFCIM